ncbi:MAG: T9SS type A sorting domain-containing protein [Ignavibacteriaceae bacterium]|nr:T9SS type A sorting domain-containing protein [Ignavibacteriaceae bacterium]
MPEQSFVTIKIYDILGNEIAILVNEEKTTGSYEVEFNASKLSSGIYFYTLSAGNFFSTKKMILLR